MAWIGSARSPPGQECSWAPMPLEGGPHNFLCALRVWDRTPSAAAPSGAPVCLPASRDGWGTCWGRLSLWTQVEASRVPRCPSAGPAPEMASMLSLQEENQMLQQELSRVEDLLAQSRAERDELAIKYSAVSERVGAAGHGAPDGEGGPWSQAACVQVAAWPPRVALNTSLHSAHLLPSVATVTTWSFKEWMG